MERTLNTDEKRLVQALLERAATLQLPSNWLNEVRVISMKDGGMGSLRFVSGPSEQQMAKQAAEIQFLDSDGVDVIASLNLNAEGLPCELDIWRVDFKPLVQIPESF